MNILNTIKSWFAPANDDSAVALHRQKLKIATSALAVGGGLAAMYTQALASPSGSSPVGNQPALGILTPEMFGAIGDGVTDDLAAFRQCLAAFGTKGGGIMLLGPKTYLLSGPISLTPGLKLVGSSWSRGEVAGKGTVLLRGSPGELVRMYGESILRKGKHINGISIEDITIDGGNKDGPLVVASACAYLNMRRVFMHQSNHELLVLREVFDSRFNDCAFEWGGTADGTHPMVSLVSGNGWEFTNQIAFDGCRWESIRGTALATVGDNTNGIYFTSCKLESAYSNLPLLRFSNAVAIHFNLLQAGITGSAGHTISSVIEFTNSQGITGIIHTNHFGATDGRSAEMASFVELTNCTMTRLDVMVYGGKYPIGGNFVKVNRCPVGQVAFNVITSLRPRL